MVNVWLKCVEYGAHMYSANRTPEWFYGIKVMPHEHHDVSNHWQINCLFNSLFRLTTEEHQSFSLWTSHYWPFVRGIHQSLVDSPHKGPVMQKVFPIHDISNEVVIRDKNRYQVLHQSNTIVTVAELRSTENARCTITIRFVYEYATLYLLHAIPYVRMLRCVYDPKRVSPINYTIFPR